MNGTNPLNYNIKITAFPRIHMTLIGMNADGYRINGGIGFSISEPRIFFSVKSSDSFSLKDLRGACFTSSEINRLKDKIDNIRSEYKLKYSIQCEIGGECPTHFGFGSSTATYLACIEALFILNDYPYDNELLVRISSRGGTSGIGINTYFKGGFVFDIGIRNKNNSSIAPSSISTQRANLPLVLNHIKLPNWKVGLILPSQIKSKSELEEIEFFKRTCPIDKEAVSSILYESLYGVFSGIYENDFDIFCDAVKTIQGTKWKKEERGLYGKAIDILEEHIYNSGVKCVGMSSLGPGLYFLSEDIEKAYSKLNLDEYNILESMFNNKPRIIEYE